MITNKSMYVAYGDVETFDTLRISANAENTLYYTGGNFSQTYQLAEGQTVDVPYDCFCVVDADPPYIVYHGKKRFSAFGDRAAVQLSQHSQSLRTLSDSITNLSNQHGARLTALEEKPVTEVIHSGSLSSELDLTECAEGDIAVSVGDTGDTLDDDFLYTENMYSLSMPRTKRRVTEDENGAYYGYLSYFGTASWGGEEEYIIENGTDLYIESECAIEAAIRVEIIYDEEHPNGYISSTNQSRLTVKVLKDGVYYIERESLIRDMLAMRSSLYTGAEEKADAIIFVFSKDTIDESNTQFSLYTELNWVRRPDFGVVITEEDSEENYLLSLSPKREDVPVTLENLIDYINFLVEIGTYKLTANKADALSAIKIINGQGFDGTGDVSFHLSWKGYDSNTNTISVKSDYNISAYSVGYGIFAMDFGAAEDIYLLNASKQPYLSLEIQQPDSTVFGTFTLKGFQNSDESARLSTASSQYMLLYKGSTASDCIVLNPTTSDVDGHSFHLTDLTAEEITQYNLLSADYPAAINARVGDKDAFYQSDSSDAILVRYDENANCCVKFICYGKAVNNMKFTNSPKYIIGEPQLPVDETWAYTESGITIQEPTEWLITIDHGIVRYEQLTIKHY